MTDNEIADMITDQICPLGETFVFKGFPNYHERTTCRKAVIATLEYVRKLIKEKRKQLCTTAKATH